ncbi:MAG TPA: methyltransferase domain-containing protein [Terriglobia bacterium]|nr:methyltransferase domain-containing protein [Terriglobia bacterium]
MPGGKETVQAGMSLNHTTRCLPPADAYALWSQTYDIDPNPLLTLEEREMLPLLPGLAGAFVLDVGCGTGRWLNLLLARGARHGVGFDLSLEMLGQARRKLPLPTGLVRADCAAIPIAAGVTDLAVCSFAAGYVKDLNRVGSELSRVLRKGGRLLVSDVHPAGVERGWRRTFRHDGEVIEIANFKFSLDHLCSTFEEHGLTLERIISPGFGEADRPIFRRCGKEHLFEQAQPGPAIFISSFRLDATDAPDNR